MTLPDTDNADFAGRRLRTSTIMTLVVIVAAMAFFAYHADLAIFSMESGPDKGALTNDALGYYKLASSERTFYEAGIREPLFVYSYKMAITHWDTIQDQITIRYLTGMFGVLLILLVAILGWQLAGPYVGGIAAWMYAYSSFNVYYAVSGLRQSIVGCLTVLMIILLAKVPRTKWGNILRILTVGCICGALPVLRVSSFLVIILILLGWTLVTLAANREYLVQTIMESCLYTLVAVLFYLPFALNCKSTYGYYLYPMHHHATFWRNHEFAGEPGFPTRESVIGNSYTGTLITASDYMYGLHTRSQVVQRYLKGYWLSLTEYLPRIFTWVKINDNQIKFVQNRLYWFWIPGLLVVLYSWRSQSLIAIGAAAAQFPFAFIVPLNVVLPDRFNAGVEPRFTMPMAPFMAIIVAVGIVKCGQIAFIKIRSITAKPADDAQK